MGLGLWGFSSKGFDSGSGLRVTPNPRNPRKLARNTLKEPFKGGFRDY